MKLRRLTAAIHRRPTLALYAVVLAVSITGASQAAAGWLEWVLPAAVAAVAAAELGGVVLSIHADRRRNLGESALPARVLAAAVAAMAVAVNWFGHYGPTGRQLGQAAFFAGFSALGFLVYLIDSAAGRRDALRAAGKLADTPPVYGLAQWVRHPGITRRARRLAAATAEVRAAELAATGECSTPRLGMLASLAAAAAEVRADRRHAAIASALRSRIKAAAGSTMAEIAVHTYDLGRVAAELAGSADYAGLTGILAAELTAERIGGHATGRQAVTEPAERADLAEVPVSGAPVNLAAVSKTAAVHYAHTALGQVPAARVVAYLAEHGVAVSESQVYKVRRQVAAEPAELAEVAPYTPPALPAALAATEPAPRPRTSRPRTTPQTTRPTRVVNGQPWPPALASATPAE